MKTKVYLKGRKAPLQFKSKESAERFIAGAMKETGAPRSWFTLKEEDEEDAILEMGMSILSSRQFCPELQDAIVCILK